MALVEIELDADSVAPDDVVAVRLGDQEELGREGDVSDLDRLECLTDADKLDAGPELERLLDLGPLVI